MYLDSSDVDENHKRKKKENMSTNGESCPLIRQFLLSVCAVAIRSFKKLSKASRNFQKPLKVSRSLFMFLKASVKGFTTRWKDE